MTTAELHLFITQKTPFVECFLQRKAVGLHECRSQRVIVMGSGSAFRVNVKRHKLSASRLEDVQRTKLLSRRTALGQIGDDPVVLVKGAVVEDLRKTIKINN